MSLAAATVIVAFGLALIGFTALVFARRAMAERVLGRFASTARAHYTEQVVRLLIGAALVVRAPAMLQSSLFLLVGWAIVISSAVLMCAPWQWHRRFGERIRPMFNRYLCVYAVGSFAFGVLLLYGVFASREAGGS